MEEKDYREETVDYLIIGTGPVEAALCCILANKGFKVICIDKNDSYGSEFSTFSLSELEAKQKDLFEFSKTYSAEKYEEAKDADDTEWNIDLCPKLLLLHSSFKDLILQYGIDTHVEFSPIKSSYIYTDKLYKIPRSEMTSFSSNLVGLYEKTKLMKFFYSLRGIEKNETSAENLTMEEVYSYYGLSTLSQNFIGHALAMNVNDEYLKRPAIETYRKIISYVKSIGMYNSYESPFVYPFYGLSDISQGFVRKASVHGAVFMLGCSYTMVGDSSVQVEDLNNEKYVFKTKKFIVNPNVFFRTEDAKSTVFIYTAVCICKKNSIFPGSRNITFIGNEYFENDVFAVVLNNESNSCPEGYEIVILSVKSAKTINYVLFYFEKVIFTKLNLIKMFFRKTAIMHPENTENTIYTGGLDESPLMNRISEDIAEILDLLGISNK